MWDNHDKFLETVSNAWSMHLRGTTMYKLCNKLKAVKDPLKDLNRKHFSHISARAEAAEEELIRAQQQLYDNPEDQYLQMSIPDLRSKALKLANAEFKFLFPASKSQVPK